MLYHITFTGVRRMKSYDLTAPVLRKPESQFKNQKENGTGYERK